MKIVINDCFGGFSLSDQAIRLYLEKKGLEYWEYDEGHSALMGATFLLCPPDEYEKMREKADNTPVGPDRYKEVNAVYFSMYDIDRWDPILVEVVEELEEKANGRFASLRVVDIPFEDGDGWYIDEYDGVETVHENHRSW